MSYIRVYMGKPGRPSHTIESLKLDVASAVAGQTWKLIPSDYRTYEHVASYPLPSRGREIEIVARIEFPVEKRNCGVTYIRRCRAELERRGSKRLADIASTEVRRQKLLRRVANSSHEFRKKAREADRTIREAVEGVRDVAAREVATLSDLFSLGRKGIRDQMEAHLNGKKLKGEKISASAFRDCFKIVTAAVKGLGLPSDQRKPATEAVMEEVAASLRDTQEAIALSTPPDKLLQ